MDDDVDIVGFPGRDKGVFLVSLTVREENAASRSSPPLDEAQNFM